MREDLTATRDILIQELTKIRQQLQAQQENTTSQLFLIKRELADKERSLAEQQQTIHRQQQDLLKLIGWLECQHTDIQAVRASLTWKMGDMLVSVLRKFKLVPGATAFEHIQEIHGQYEEWKTLHSYSHVFASEGGVEQDETRADPARLSESLKNFLPGPLLPQWRHAKPIDVLIPVYNGYAHLQRLIPALVKNTRIPHRVILFDDASDDGETLAYLEQLAAEHEHFILVRSEKNLGFVGAVNTASAYLENHFVLLNQDTEVPPHWLERLMLPIMESPRIASTTPFSNSATICSFPNFCEDNELPPGVSTEQADRYFQQVCPNWLDIPTGVGFCMGFNKHATDEIGLFNPIFGRGYAEENDWCMRARYRGYRNVMVPNLFVYHTHGGIFESAERSKLLQDNLDLLNRLHPDYLPSVHDFIRRDPLQRLRPVLALQVLARDGISLLVDHDMGGGANFFREQKLEYLKKSRSGVAFLFFNAHSGQYRLQCEAASQRFEWEISEIAEVMALFQLVPLRDVHLNSLVFFTQPLAWVNALYRFKTEFAAEKLTLYLHDYFPVCPQYTLLDPEEKYCALPGPETCSKCLAFHGPELERQTGYCAAELDIERWRSAWEAFLGVSDEIICFSQASRDILLAAYPALEHDKFKIIPHEVSDFAPLSYTPAPDKLRIGVLGAINAAKGLNIVKQLADIIEKQDAPAEVVIIGFTSEDPIAHPRIVTTGKYAREDLPRLIQKHAINLVLIPSVWPETFCYTVEEAIRMGLKVACFNLGAPPERLADYPDGLILDTFDSAEILQALLTWWRRDS